MRTLILATALVLLAGSAHAESVGTLKKVSPALPTAAMECPDATAEVLRQPTGMPIDTAALRDTWRRATGNELSIIDQARIVNWFNFAAKEYRSGIVCATLKADRVNVKPVGYFK